MRINYVFYSRCSFVVFFEVDFFGTFLSVVSKFLRLIAFIVFFSLFLFLRLACKYCLTLKYHLNYETVQFFFCWLFAGKYRGRN